MSKTYRFIWEIYYLIVLLFTFRKTFNFFDPSSDVNLYFSILTGFDPLLRVIYALNLLQIVLNVIHLLPLALYIYSKRLFSPVVWQVLLLLKVVFDTTGHSFEMKILVSTWHHDPWVAIALFVSSTAIYVPAYAALFMYAFLQHKLKLEDF